MRKFLRELAVIPASRKLDWICAPIITGPARGYSAASAARICGASWLTLPAPRVRIRSPSWAAAATACDGGGKVGRERDARALNALRQPLRRHARNRLLAGRVNGQHDHGVGVCKRADKLLQKISGARVPVRLKDHVDLAARAGARRLQRGANLGGVVAVIIDNGHAARLAALLEAPVDAAKVLEPFGNLLRRNFKLPRNGDGGRGVQHIVPAGNMQLERTERSSGSVHQETRERTSLPRCRDPALAPHPRISSRKSASAATP